MELSVRDISKADVYKLLNCMVVPRPIAWITSVSAQGVVNLAPFSTCTIVQYDPPLLGVNMMFRAGDGSRKDTARNAIESGEFIVHIADDSMVDALHASGFSHPPEVSEVELLDLPTVPGVDVAVPRLRDAPLALECKLFRVITFGPGSEFVVGEIVRIHARPGLVSDFRIDTRDLRPLSRLGGPVYGTLGEVIVKAPAKATWAPLGETA
jgi:flavin reductase (DIM6/NTAB) family NADH-FMN oxidoreductase RutF